MKRRWLRKTALCLVSLSLLSVAACGGREANPVAQFRPGDEKRSCERLKAEIANNEVEIVKLIPGDDTTGIKNVALGVSGLWLIAPWFFMDFKDAEGTEIRAFTQRNQWLRDIAGDMGCTVPPSKIKFEEEPEAEVKTPER